MSSLRINKTTGRKWLALINLEWSLMCENLGLAIKTSGKDSRLLGTAWLVFWDTKRLNWGKIAPTDMGTRLNRGLPNQGIPIA
jgi:hypothetical protein